MFQNLRHVFQWGKIGLEVDKCKFPHEMGYFVRFPPEEATIYEVFRFLQTNGISYMINLKSKTALFFHGLPQAAPAKPQFVSPIIPPVLSLPLIPSFPEKKATTLPVPVPLITVVDTSPQPSTTTAPNSASTDSLIIVNSKETDRSARMKRESSTVSILSDSTEANEARKTKRGRKSLVEKIIEKGDDIDVDSLPPMAKEILDELGIDLTKVDPADLPNIVEQYQKKRSSKASARYRRNKNQKLDELKMRNDELEQHVEELQARVNQLESLVKQYHERYGEL